MGRYGRTGFHRLGRHGRIGADRLGQLGFSVCVIESEKLGAGNRAQALMTAMRLGLIKSGREGPNV